MGHRRTSVAVLVLVSALMAVSTALVGGATLPIALPDEPLNNLDGAHSTEMMNHLESAARDLSRTIPIVAHDVNVAARYADRICAVKDGQVVRLSTREEIMRTEVLSEIVGTPVQVIEGPSGPLACYW